MQAAGIPQFGNAVGLLELPGPRPLRAGEILLNVHASGVGNWDEFVRTGSWDTGGQPPMALGVQAAGLVAAVGDPAGERKAGGLTAGGLTAGGLTAGGLKAGDRVATHSLPLREQGSWAETYIAAAEHVALVPPGVSLDAAAALPIPALTADQVLTDALDIRIGQTLLVHGAGGVTGGMLVQLAAHYGARVIATASRDSAERLLAMGAESVLDYHQAGWPGRVREVTGGGADTAVNAAPGGERDAIRAVRDGGRLATITSDPPDGERSVTVLAVQVVPDGARLARLLRLLAQGALTVSIGARYPLDQAGAALAQVRHGTHGTAVLLHL